MALPVSLAKAREALLEVQEAHLGNNPGKDPVMWDIALALRGIADALERAEMQQHQILHELRQMRR